MKSPAKKGGSGAAPGPKGSGRAMGSAHNPSPTGATEQRNDSKSKHSSSKADAATTEAKEYLAKLQKRQTDWRWNRPLLLLTSALVLLAAGASYLSYRYHTEQTSQTYFARAQASKESGDLADQAKWLERYLMIQPDDTEAVVSLAVAADEAVESARRFERPPLIDRARRLLNSAIAQLGSTDSQQVNELRGRLIKRLLQQGGAWYREAERQIVSLAADADDPQANRWMAEALVGQVRLSRYDPRSADKYDAEDAYWNWLSHQKPGEVLYQAIQLNPTEVELLNSLVDLWQSSPELFAQVEGDQDQRAAQLEERVEAALGGLASNTDSRSRWIRYRFEQGRGQSEKADQIILPAAEDAAKRLAVAAAEAKLNAPDASANENASADDSNPSPQVDADSQSIAQTWDYILLSEAARRISESDPPRARGYYDKLTAYRPSAVPANVTERVYLLSGQLVLELGDIEAALETWRRGLEVLPDSLDLLGSLARLEVYQLQTNPSLLDPDQYESDLTADANAEPKVEVAQASATLSRYEQAIESLSTRMFQASEASMPREAKLALGRQLETARWRAQILQAAVATMEQRPRDAIALLRAAIASAANINDAERIAAILQLAALYQAEGVWDQVAMTLDEAIKRTPENLALRARAADAWARAGDQNQSLEQWRMAGNSDSLGIQIASIEAQLNDQARLPASRQDFSGVRVAIRDVRNQHADVIKEFLAASAELSNQQEEGDAQEQQTTASRLNPETSQAIARLEIATVLLPPAGTDATQYWQSAAIVEPIATLARQHPNDQLIQAFAAERFALLGRTDESKQAFDRLATLFGGNSMVAAAVQARIEASQGNLLAAANRLIAFAESQSKPAEKREAAEMYGLAASYALRGSQPELAYQTLLKIPAEIRSLSIDFLLARLARQLPSDSPVFQQNNELNSPKQLSLKWENELKQKEGDTGSRWRFLQITRLIDEMRSQATAVKRDDAKLREARRTLKELLTLRPQWGEAISLEGWLLAIEGQPGRAVDYLRRGIEAGDRRIQTRTQLWQQLVLLGRESEVDDDIRATAAATGQPLEQYASARIGLALRQGDYQRSVDVARQAADQSPNDAVAQIVFARTAAQAATQPSMADSSAELLQQARQAVELAASNAGANRSSVVSASMAVTIASRDEAAIRAEIDKLANSSLPEYERLMLGSQALLALKDYDAALPLLKKADELRPSSRTQLALAALFRELKRSEDEVAALRLAQQRDPQNAMLRNQLAQALVARDGGDINWGEIEQLLQNASESKEINRFLYAILLGTRGQIKQQDQAATILREIIQERNPRSDDAARVLAAIRRRQLETLLAAQATKSADDKQNQPADITTADMTSPPLAELGDEIRQLYDALTSKNPPVGIDIYRYADFLLQRGTAEDLTKVEQLSELLKSTEQGGLASLEISIRYAQKIGDQKNAPQIINQWVDSAGSNGEIDDSNVASIAGASLIKLGFAEEGLDWFQRAYEQNSELLSNYVITLVQLDRATEAAVLAASHFELHRDARSAMLLCELMLSQPELERNPTYREILEQAIQEFDQNAPLLESVATLRLQRNDFATAIDLYQRAQEIEPLRVRTLNNLAMAFSEVPGREFEGILPIEQAIDLAGQVPELLDTKGVVLLKAGKLVEAEQVFRSAIAKQPAEPRFQFHLILSLMQQGKEADAKSEWTKLQLDKLDPFGLTAAERQILEQMKQTYGS